MTTVAAPAHRIPAHSDAGDPGRRPVVVAVADPRDRGRLARRLRRDGHTVHAVATGPDVIAAVGDRPPAAIVLDWLLPGGRGIEVCRWLRRHPSLRTTPVLLLTARGDRAQVTEAFQAGADDVLTRPLDDRMLAGLLRDRLGARGGR